MSAIFELDRAAGALYDAQGRRFDAASRARGTLGSRAAAGARCDAIDRLAAATWLQRESGHPLRVPIGVIGPREATPAQLARRAEGRRAARAIAALP